MNANFLLAVCLASPLLFAALVWLTRAGSKRTRAAVAGCLTAAIFSLGWDALAKQMHWWSYPTGNDVLAILALSISGAFVFGGAAGLVGWRTMRAMGWTGVATFLAAFVGVGMLRDHTLQANTDIFAFGEGAIPQVMAAIGYLTMALTVQVTMLIMAGPPRSDELRAG